MSEQLSCFEEHYVTFIQQHLKKRKGERARRLLQGHGHAEKQFLENLWWPAFGNFQHLHPEYQVYDFKDGTRFIDFAYIQNSLRLAIEIDGYGPHLANVSRSQFSDQLMRQNHLVIDGWFVLRFSYDDIKERPRMCQQMLQQFMGRWVYGATDPSLEINYVEKEIIRFGINVNRSIKPHDLLDLLLIKNVTARKILHAMVNKNLLTPAGSGKRRIRGYHVHPSILNNWRYM